MLLVLLLSNNKQPVLANHKLSICCILNNKCKNAVNLK